MFLFPTPTSSRTTVPWPLPTPSSLPLSSPSPSPPASRRACRAPAPPPHRAARCLGDGAAGLVHGGARGPRRQPSPPWHDASRHRRWLPAWLPHGADFSRWSACAPRNPNSLCLTTASCSRRRDRSDPQHWTVDKLC